MSAQIGSLAVRVSANTKPYSQGMRNTRGPADKLRKQINSIAGRAAKLTAAMAAAGAATTAALTKRGLEAIDAQKKLGDQIGATQAEVAGMTRAFSDAGIAEGQLRSNLQALNKRLGEAQEGTGQAGAALDKMGLSADELAQMPLPQRLDTIGAAINNMGTSTERAAATADLFSRSGLDMINVFQQGEGAIQRATEEARRFGTGISQVDAAKVERANDAMSRIGDVVQGVSNRLAVQLAPLLELISGRFTEMAQESQGFKDETMDSLESVRRAIGFIADAVEGVKRTFQVAGKSAALQWLFMEQGALQVADIIAKGPVRMINALISAINKIPGMPEIEEMEFPDFAKNIEERMERVDDAIAIGIKDINDLLLKPLPSDAIESFWSEAQSRANEAQEAFRSAYQELNPLELPGAGNDDEDQESPADREARRQRERFEILRNFADLQREFESEQYAAEMERLRAAKENELLTEKEHATAVEELRRKHQSTLTAIDNAGLSEREKFQQMSMKNQVKQVAGSLEQMTASVARENKAMFRLNQVAGIANAIVNTAEGVTKALSAYPPPLSFAMAAAQAAAGAAQISAIKSQSFSSGGSAPSQVGTTPVTQQPGAGQQQNPSGGGSSTIINLQGDSFGRAQVRDLIEELNEAQRDGGRIVVA